MKQLLTTLENSRNYTLAVAEAMPEKSYSFKPDGAGWTFIEQIHHIAYGIEWWQENYIKGNQRNWNQPEISGDKKAVISYLKNAFDSLQRSLEMMKATDDRVQGFHATLDHVTHHRAQAVLYLRCCEINPPEYTY